MSLHTFRVVVTDPIDDELADRLFEGGADDGVIETGPEGHSIGFDREAESFGSAVLSAIADVESCGLEVLRIEPDELVSAADVAERTGRSRQSISSLIAGARGPGDWPRPVAGNARSSLWRWFEVAAWFERFDGSVSVNPDHVSVLGAVNWMLATRTRVNALEPGLRRAVIAGLLSEPAR